MVTLKNLFYEIKNKTLLKDISVCFEKSNIHLILGPNGAGKSTLIKLISGELKPTNGDVIIDNTNLRQSSPREQAKFRAVLSQNIDLSFPLKVHEVVLMGRYPHFDGKAANVDLEICKRAMQLFDIQKFENRNYLSLSGGEKQRVQFARVFAQIWEPIQGKSRLLLLDEPLTFLDIFYQYDLMKKIQGFMASNTDLTVIGVVHDINIAYKYSDTIMLLKESELFDFGAAKNVLTEQTIYEVFRVKIENRFNFI